MSNEAIRLPSGEVNSSVHYQKMFALSKTVKLFNPARLELIKRQQNPSLTC